MAYVISDDCIACGSCSDACPLDAIIEGDVYKIDEKICADCGACAEECPMDAISKK
ncbi:MAG: 4Fe-4S binding protein [Christensenellaceae bacterium]|nr:4Fe-4S binding protein [Christensenellaceae bacterium]